LLSSIGLGFLLQVKYLLPITFLFLLLAVGALLYKAKGRRGYLPFFLGLAGAATIIVSKFIYNSDVFMYIGLAALVVASFLHSWPKGWLRRIIKK